MLRGATKKNVLLFAIAALALCASPGSRAAGDCLETSWADTTGSWFVAANWQNSQPPTGTIGAQINNGGTAQINTSTPMAAACDLFVGFDATQSGNVSVSTGSLTVGHEAEFGGHGKGTLTVTNGGSASVGFLTIGNLVNLVGPPSNGTVSVDASSLTCATGGGIWVGGEPNLVAGGIGLLTVTNGGTVSAASVYVFSSGTLTGNGTVSTTSTNGTAVDGALAPSGQLTISGAGNLTLNSSAAVLSNITPSSQDNVVVSASGGAFLNGRLAVTMTGTFTLGTTYTLLTATPGGLHNAFFASVSIKFPTGQNFTPEIVYDYVGNKVNLYIASNTGP